MQKLLETLEEFMEPEEREAEVFAYCEHCGFPILSQKDAMHICASGDLIHRGCWEEYAADHPEYFEDREGLE